MTEKTIKQLKDLKKNCLIMKIPNIKMYISKNRSLSSERMLSSSVGHRAFNLSICLSIVGTYNSCTCHERTATHNSEHLATLNASGVTLTMGRAEGAAQTAHTALILSGYSLVQRVRGVAPCFELLQVYLWLVGAYVRNVIFWCLSVCLSGTI